MSLFEINLVYDALLLKWADADCVWRANFVVHTHKINTWGERFWWDCSNSGQENEEEDCYDLRETEGKHNLDFNWIKICN